MTPEERALAERLARLSPHGEPSPALDARILAAAHAAATTPQRQHPTRRWPLGLGIAASLTLAVGIAWQLRPLQEATTYDEAASATAVQAQVGAAADSAAAPAERAPADVAAPSRAPVSEPSREATNVRPAPRPVAPAARAPAPEAPPQEEPAVVFDAPTEPAPVATQAPPAPPAAAPVRAPVAPAPAAEAASAAERNSAATGVAATSRESAFAEDAADEDVPPATADSPEVREAWLQRIRELATAGDTGDARASLREFIHRYPNHPVPDDLRNLLE